MSFFTTRNEIEESKDNPEMFPFLQDKILAIYTNKSSEQTADFREQGISINDIIRMDSDQLRQTRFYNLQDKQRVSENELNFESLF